MSLIDVPYAVSHEAAVPVPYPPSFVDRFIDFIQGLPIPYVLTYSLLFVLQVAAYHVLAWLDGWLSAPQFHRVILLFPLWTWGPLAIITYLDSLSVVAYSKFSLLLDITPEVKERLAYEFTTMPARSVIISGLIWSAVYIIFWLISYDATITTYGLGPVAIVGFFLAGFVSFSVGSVLYYHSIRQLTLANHTVRMVARFDLFRLDPVYAFSVVTSQTGICWIILVSLELLVAPLDVTPIQKLVTLIVQVTLVLAAFFLPLRVVNRRLVLEKQKQLAELDQRVKATLARLHDCIDQNRLDEVGECNNALTGLNIEREILTKIPTLPWRPGLLPGFLSIVVLPILLFLVQLALERWLGG